MRRWLALVVLAFAVMVGWAQAGAEPAVGLLFSAYEVSSIPPSRSDVTYPLCDSGVVGNVAQNWGGGAVMGCRADRVMVHYSGFINIPEHQSLSFLLYSDDGGWTQIGDWAFGYWRDRGCSPSIANASLDAGLHSFDNWYYENGGGACNVLYWNIDNAGWTVVPESAFTQSDVPETTVPTSTLPETTTTTEPETPTSLEATSTVAPSTSSFPSTTDTPLLETTTAVSTTVLVPSTTETTTSTTPTTSSSLSPSSSDATTTSVDTTTTSEARQVTTILPKVAPTTQEPTSTVYETRPIATTASIRPAEATTTTAAPTPQPAPELTPDRIIEAASNPGLLAESSPSEASAIFAAIDESTLTAAEGEAIVKAVQHAPTAVRQKFEQAINIFGGATDTYVPLGSTVPVKARRVIIAAGVLVTVPPPSKGKKR